MLAVSRILTVASVTNNWVLDIAITEARFDPAGFHVSEFAFKPSTCSLTWRALQIPTSLYQFARSDYHIRKLIATELESSRDPRVQWMSIACCLSIGPCL